MFRVGINVCVEGIFCKVDQGYDMARVLSSSLLVRMKYSKTLYDVG